MYGRINHFSYDNIAGFNTNIPCIYNNARGKIINVRSHDKSINRETWFQTLDNSLITSLELTTLINTRIIILYQGREIY